MHAASKNSSSTRNSNVQPTIVFMGTPDFAVPCLMALHNSDCHIPFVVTQPDRPKGRGRTLAPPPVKETALKLGYRVLQPANVRQEDFIDQLQQTAPDFLVVVAFGQILPQNILNVPKRGAVNVHASLLPKYRGPAPIQWAILRGEKETGVTTMLMDNGVDTGDMLLFAKTAIEKTETAEQLHLRLARMGADLLVETIGQMWTGSLSPKAQKNHDATYAPMLSKTDGRIKWDQSSDQIDALVRAMTPWPGAFCFWNDKRLKIIKTHSIMEVEFQAEPGMVVERFPDELCVATGDGLLCIETIQSQSGKRMAVKDFLRGNTIAPGTQLE